MLHFESGKSRMWCDYVADRIVDTILNDAIWCRWVDWFSSKFLSIKSILNSLLHMTENRSNNSWIWVPSFQSPLHFPTFSIIQAVCYYCSIIVQMYANTYDGTRGAVEHFMEKTKAKSWRAIIIIRWMPCLIRFESWLFHPFPSARTAIAILHSEQFSFD